MLLYTGRVVLDPIEQARVDAATRRKPTPEESRERWDAWGSEGIRAYRRERRAWLPAEAPRPWPVVVVSLVVEAAAAEVGWYVQKRWRGAGPSDRVRLLIVTVPPIAGAMRLMIDVDQRARRRSAHRLGLRRSGEEPPRDPMAPVALIALGRLLATLWMRVSGRRLWSTQTASGVIATRLGREWEERRRWRGWNPGSGRP